MPDMNTRVFATIAFGFVGFGLLTQLAKGASGTLETPNVPMANDYSKADYAAVLAVLNGKGKEWKYVEGSWLNRFTTLQYDGDTTSLNLFLEALTKCPHLTVHVNFFRPASTSDLPAWLVTHTAGENAFVVRINLASKAINLEKLYLPDFTQN
jgi:hypothetical protein